MVDWQYSSKNEVELGITSQLGIKFLSILKKAQSSGRAKNKNTHETCAQKGGREGTGERLRGIDQGALALAYLADLQRH